MTLWIITNVCAFADWPITNPLFFVTLFLIDFVPDGEIQNGCKYVGCDDDI